MTKAKSSKTNYNERLDDVLVSFYNHAAQDIADNHLQEGKLFTTAHTEAKQAITSLIKELVAEAMPEPSTNLTSYEAQMFIVSTEEYRQNLLKALEEV